MEKCSGKSLRKHCGASLVDQQKLAPYIASDTLTVRAESIDLSPNMVSIGTDAYKAQVGWNVVTGTVVQPGGFLSANVTVLPEK